MAFRIILSFYLFFLSPSLSSSLNHPFCSSHDSFALLQLKNSFSLDHSASLWCDEFSDDSYSLYSEFFDDSYSLYSPIQSKNLSYPKIASWGNDSNCCLWDGVTCDSMSGHVIGLDLSCSWLQGQLHSNNSLFQLSHLQALNLAYNDFNGSFISPKFGDLSTLTHLNLSNSYFVGDIPSKIAELSKLISLDLSWNKLSFHEEWLSSRLKPSTWEKFILNMTYLQELVLDDVNMSSIAPNSLSLLMNLSSSLVYLSLQNTLLQGNLDNNIFHLQNLRKLDLSRNENLMGQLPNSISHLKSLNFLSLENCQFDGSIPTSFDNLTQLTILNLASNNFSGELSFLSNLQSLTSLDLSDNYFSGGLSNVFGNHRKLKDLSIAENNIKGELPSSLCNLTQLTLLSCSFNKLTFPIACKLSNLEFLDFSHNKLQGNFIESIFSLTNVFSLSLSSNNLSGSINFHQFSKFHNLKYLDLSNNNFLSLTSDNYLNYTIPNLEILLLHSCHITSFPKFLNLPNLHELFLDDNKLQRLPESIFGFVNLSYLDLSSNNLRGPIGLYQFSNLQNLEYLDLSNNKFLSLTFDNYLNYTISNLRILDLKSCDVTSFPKFLNLPNLQGLFLADNKLQSLPESIFSFVNLLDLYLSSNNLRGPIRLHQFSKLQNLEYLDLSNNKFLSLSSDNNIHYTIPNLGTLGLSSCNINEFPKPLGKLPNLKQLILSNNKIHGNVPKWFNNVGNGSLLYLDLSQNNLTSVEYLSMRNLRSLDLSFNLLQGDLPIPSYGIKFFSVSSNKFSGEISSSFCNASSLEFLNLSHNNLSGHIPKCLVGLPYLEALDLRMNDFVGTIPNNFSKSNSLQSFHLNNNQFEGQLPFSLMHCKLLQIFDVGVNKIEDEFPNWLEGLSELQVLIIRDNKFYGTIYRSNAKHPFHKLRIFDVSNNHFSGSLPIAYIKEFKAMMNVDYVSANLDYMRTNHSYQESVMVTLKGVDLELDKIITTFTAIDLSNNMFNGGISQAIGDLSSLKGLNLSHNKFIGPIPQSIANLTNLEWLDLSSNRLIGEIPLVLANLNFLEVLNLSQNQLVGEIPRGRQFDTFSKDSFGGNLGLCGFQLSKACTPNEVGKMPRPTSSTDDKFGFGWQPVALGYGCGMVFGMFMGQIAFLTGKPEWLVRTFQARPKKQEKRTRKRTLPNHRRMK